MSLNYRLIVPPTVEPVTLALAKEHLRVDFTDDDNVIGLYITAAREYVENWLNIAIYQQTWCLYLDSFPWGDYRSTIPLDQRNPYDYSAYWSDLAIRLPKPALMQVLSINYLDQFGNQQTLAGPAAPLGTNTNIATNPAQYYVDNNSWPARIVPVAGSTWPTSLSYQSSSIQVTYTAGAYGTGTPNTCPSRIVQAILLMVSHFYEHRGAMTEIKLATMPLGVKALIAPFRFEVFGNYKSGY